MEANQDLELPQLDRQMIKAPGLQLAIVIMGVFMEMLDSSVVNVAIPKLQMDLNANTDQIQWIITSYMLVSGVVIPVSGWLIDRLGSKRLFIFALIAFTLGSALCGIAWNLDAMIFFRILQAAGGGFMAPVGTAMIFRMFPLEKRGMVMGIFGLTLMTAPALGPTLGGYFVQFASWRFLFYINVPIGIAASLLAIFVLYDFPHRISDKLDIWGFMFSTFGFFSLLFGINNVAQYGWSSLWVYPFMGLGVAFLIMLVATELLVDKPVIELRVFQSYMFTMSLLITSIVLIGLYVGVFLLPLYLQNLLGYTALETGLFMTPGALLSAVVMPVSGILFDRIGARSLGLIGLVMIVLTSYGFTFMSLDSTYATMQVLYIFRSIGIGLVMMPIITAGMSMVPPQWMNQASAVHTAVRQVASSLGLAVLASYMTHREKIHASHLAGRVAANSPQGLRLPQLQSALHALGLPDSLAHSIALEQIYGWIQKQAFVLGMNDTYMVSTLLTIVALVLTLFFGSKKESALRKQIAEGNAPARTFAE